MYGVAIDRLGVRDPLLEAQHFSRYNDLSASLEFSKCERELLKCGLSAMHRWSACVQDGGAQAREYMSMAADVLANYV